MTTRQRYAPRSPKRSVPPSRGLFIESLEDRMLLACSVSLTPTLPSPQLVGVPIEWTATPSEECPANLVYQFQIQPNGESPQMLRDFSPNESFLWTPEQEGDYLAIVHAKEGYDGNVPFVNQAPYHVDTQVSGSAAVIGKTANPLVALYSAPPCVSDTIHVEFTRASQPLDWRSTDTRPCVPGLSRNFYVAGMYPQTTYLMKYVTSDGFNSPLKRFRTGSLPSDLFFHKFTVLQELGPQSDFTQDMIYHQPVANPVPVVTDLQGNVNWYYDPSTTGLDSVSTFGSLVPGGTVLHMATEIPGFGGIVSSVLREIDFAGNPLRETNRDALNAQLADLGYAANNGFHHAVERLPDGHTAIIGSVSKTVDINGLPTPYVGDSVIILDENFQVVWYWSAFDHLDVNRGPILGEKFDEAVNWTHTNAINLTPDGNILLSMRNQDWVIKIAYEDGVGDGHVIWRLGTDGDFTVDSPDGYPWFSHQHDARYINDTTIVLFDNGNTRKVADPSANSRGQVWVLDETTMTAELVLNADMGNYSAALGSAQQLPNGNYSFTSGFLMKSEGTDVTGQGDDNGQSIEVLPDGSKSYVLENKPWLYRAYRLRGMYEGTALIPPIPSPVRTSSPDLSTFLGSVALAELNGEDVTSLPLLNDPRDQASFRYVAFSDVTGAEWGANPLRIVRSTPFLRVRGTVDDGAESMFDTPLSRAKGIG